MFSRRTTEMRPASGIGEAKGLFHQDLRRSIAFLQAWRNNWSDAAPFRPGFRRRSNRARLNWSGGYLRRHQEASTC